MFIKNVWKEKIVRYRLILILVLVYSSIHLTNLTLLPIFNDEAIYLDWGWAHTHMPGHLYDALLDAKQPLMIWVFGIFERFFSDPLFAGRFASVLIGFVTLLGIYSITKKILNEKTAFLAAMPYSVIPIFVFYNRQALLEPAIACVGVWSFNALLNLFRQPSARNGIILGLILGTGFFIKSSSLIFFASSSILMLFYIFKKRRVELVKPYFISLATFIAVNFLLLINPTFWQTFPSNSRYSYTPAELFTFPFSTWMNNLIGFFEIGIVFITPFIFLAGLMGIFMMARDKRQNTQVFLAFFILALLLEIILTKGQNQRYLVAFLSFLVIPASYVLNILWKDNIWKRSIVIISLFVPLALSITLIFNPEYYVLQLYKISKYSEVGYIYGQTSGYGIRETMEYIKEHSPTSKLTMVLFGLNIGNPESAVDLYSQRNPQLFGLHIDSKFFPGIEQYECMASKYPAFFVTRDNQLIGMERYFLEEVVFPNPNGNNYSVRIYTLKKNCNGKTLSLSDTYQNSIDRILQLRSETGY